jgi:hydroxyacid-oxoacid transhydrogenase
LIAIPTTTGTGSETTGVAVFDLVSRHLKTGISHPYLKPGLGILDPENTRTLPSAVAAATGLDVLSHALESYTARPFTERSRPARPSDRPTYQGANPVSDIWSLRALEMVREFLPRAVADADDLEARGQMLLAAAMAGIGFGSAGVHLPHAMAYPVAGRVREFRPRGYQVDHPLVPHGISVILHTAAVARFTATASPRRHLRAAEALGAEIRHAADEDAGKLLAEQVLDYLRRLEVPNGLGDLGYNDEDIPALVEGTLAQRRLTCLAPREADAATLDQLFRESLRLWS